VIGRGINENIYDKSIIVPALDDQGNSFCEAVMTTEEYKQVQKRTAKEIWLAEYQQQPIDIEGRLFSDYKRINQNEFDEFISTNQVEGTLAYIDVSDTGMDYTAMAIAAIVKNQTYIVDYVFNRDNTDLTIPQCAALLNKWNVSYCRVESNNMGAMFARNLQNLTKTKILQVANTTNKITRIIMQSAFISQRMQFVVKEEQQCLTFIENMLSFSKEGKNKHDDAPDCLAGLSLFLQSMFKNLS
jgi:predicted phage terminase large subunit-like protein